MGSLRPRQREGIIIASKSGHSSGKPLDFVESAKSSGEGASQNCSSTQRSGAGSTGERSPLWRLRIISSSKERRANLRELRTDYLDILLLHECTETDVKKNELLCFLQGLQTQGKIRQFGIATGIEETVKIAKSRPAFTLVVQIASSIWNMNINRLTSGGDGLRITHSTLTGRFHELTGRIASDDWLAAQWKSATQIDPRDYISLAQLLLAHALYLNADGIVLFFSSNPENIKASVKVALEKAISLDQIRGLNFLVQNKDVMLAVNGNHRDHLSVS